MESLGSWWRLVDHAQAGDAHTLAIVTAFQRRTVVHRGGIEPAAIEVHDMLIRREAECIHLARERLGARLWRQLWVGVRDGEVKLVFSIVQRAQLPEQRAARYAPAIERTGLDQPLDQQAGQPCAATQIRQAREWPSTPGFF